MSHTELERKMEKILAMSESHGDVDESETEETVVAERQNVSYDDKHSVSLGNFVEDEIDDSALNCYQGHHSDKDETTDVSVFTEDVTQDLYRDRSLHTNEDLENSKADQVDPSGSESQSGEYVLNPAEPEGSVVATVLSMPRVSDSKPSLKSSRFRKLWAERNPGLEKTAVNNNLLLLPSVVASSSALETSGRLQKVPSISGSERKPWTTSEATEIASLPPIPSVELAIHMGLYRTLVAFITPADGKFHHVANVQNHLYWNECEHELTPAFDEALASASPLITFEGDLGRAMDRTYDFVLCQRQFSWVLQDVLSQFLVCLKRKAEVDLRVEFRVCVVAVPQFLNDSQRVQVQHSATIAGFDTVNLVNDTTAIAVAHMVDGESVKGNVVVVNTQEGPVDVASFAFDHGTLECRGITGYYFYDDQTGFWRALIGGIKELIIGYPANSAEMFFTQKELGISPSSPRTEFLLLGEGENHDLCFKAISKAVKYAKDKIHGIQLESVVYGTAYICSLRSQDPFNPVLLKWQDKLQPSSKAINSQVLDEVEIKILRPQGKGSRENFNAAIRHPLTPEEVQHRRTRMLTSNKGFLHRDKLRIMELMKSMGESHVPSDDQTRLISTRIHQHFWTVITKLLTEDEELNFDDLKRIKGEIKALRIVVQAHSSYKD